MYLPLAFGFLQAFTAVALRFYHLKFDLMNLTVEGSSSDWSASDLMAIMPQMSIFCSYISSITLYNRFHKHFGSHIQVPSCLDVGRHLGSGNLVPIEVLNVTIQSLRIALLDFLPVNVGF